MQLTTKKGPMRVLDACEHFADKVYEQTWSHLSNAMEDVAEEMGLDAGDFTYEMSVKFVGVDRFIEFLTDLALDNIQAGSMEFAQECLEDIRALQRMPGRFSEISAKYDATE